jgi:hypothetical protein
MSNSSHTTPSTEHAERVQAALAEAHRLRQQAIRDCGATAYADFWRGANAVWEAMVSGQVRAVRSARRWQARLQRHRADVSHPPHSPA